MAGPDFLSTHRRQNWRRQPVRGRRGTDTAFWLTPLMIGVFAATLLSLRFFAAVPAPVGVDGVPVRVVSESVAGETAMTLSRAGTAAPAYASQGDLHSARFGLCHTGGGRNCVVDGDTFWFAGEKYRIADIDTPETHPARCAREAALGNAATGRLRAWLNDGAFSLDPIDRDSDRYGRKLRIVTRGGTSVGDALIAEGLARPWEGARRPWC